MRINVGSQNKVKIDAVAETLQEYPMFRDAAVAGVAVNTEEFGHPKTAQATVQGAVDRAKNSFKDCDYSVGLESGLLEVPQAKSGYMEFTACAIYDGKRHHLGFSPGFEWPDKVADLILSGLDGSQAFREAGFTDHPKIGDAEGAIFVLSGRRMDRKEYTMPAIRMALIQLENSELY
jgi:inosine/xanthosine triphosphatase